MAGVQRGASVSSNSTGLREWATLQAIGDYEQFGHRKWTATKDLERRWTEPHPNPGRGRRSVGGGLQEGVCDVVPEYHAPTRSVLAVGHNVYYQNGVLARPQRERWPMVVVRSAEGKWSEPRRLPWDDPRGSAIYTCGCAQRVTLDDGSVLIPLSFGPKGRTHRSAATVLCSFDGEKLQIRKVGGELTTARKSGV